MEQLAQHGCVKVSNWYLNENGKVKLDFPASIENDPGVLIIANKDEVMYIASTIHYGPRIRDFIHSINGDSGNARIHGCIAEYLSGNKDLMLWRKDDPSHKAAKLALKALFNSTWSS